MKYSLGLGTPDFPRWYTGVPQDRGLEFAIFALTPGIPPEWLWHVLRIPAGLRRTYGRAIVRHNWEKAWPLAQENAGTITLEDGWAMLKLIKPKKYRGAVPHWSAMAIRDQLSKRRPADVYGELGISRMRLYKWRRSVFDPLTLQRVVAAIGSHKEFMRHDPTLRAPPWRNPDHPMRYARKKWYQPRP